MDQPEQLNSNCLDGMRCPKCGSLEPFIIGANCAVKMYDDGSDEYIDPEWEDDSYCSCCRCDFTGEVYDFTIDKSERTPSPAQQLLEAAKLALSCLENCYAYTREDQEYNRSGELKALRDAITRMEEDR
jgi:hypothetical protein